MKGRGKKFPPSDNRQAIYRQFQFFLVSSSSSLSSLKSLFSVLGIPVRIDRLNCRLTGPLRIFVYSPCLAFLLYRMGAKSSSSRVSGPVLVQRSANSGVLSSTVSLQEAQEKMKKNLQQGKSEEFQLNNQHENIQNREQNNEENPSSSPSPPIEDVEEIPFSHSFPLEFFSSSFPPALCSLILSYVFPLSVRIGCGIDSYQGGKLLFYQPMASEKFSHHRGAAKNPGEGKKLKSRGFFIENGKLEIEEEEEDQLMQMISEDVKDRLKSRHYSAALSFQTLDLMNDCRKCKFLQEENRLFIITGDEKFLVFDTNQEKIISSLSGIESFLILPASLGLRAFLVAQRMKESSGTKGAAKKGFLLNILQIESFKRLWTIQLTDFHSLDFLLILQGKPSDDKKILAIGNNGRVFSIFSLKPPEDGKSRDLPLFQFSLARTGQRRFEAVEIPSDENSFVCLFAPQASSRLEIVDLSTGAIVWTVSLDPQRTISCAALVDQTYLIVGHHRPEPLDTVDSEASDVLILGTPKVQIGSLGSEFSRSRDQSTIGGSNSDPYCGWLTIMRFEENSSGLRVFPLMECRPPEFAAAENRMKSIVNPSIVCLLGIPGSRVVSLDEFGMLRFWDLSDEQIHRIAQEPLSDPGESTGFSYRPLPLVTCALECQYWLRDELVDLNTYKINLGRVKFGDLCLIEDPRGLQAVTEAIEEALQARQEEESKQEQTNDLANETIIQ